MKNLMIMILLLGVGPLACVTTVDGFRLPPQPKPQRTEADLKRDVEENPDDGTAYVTLGYHYWANERQPRRARPYLERGIELQGRRVYTSPHYWLGAVCWELGDWDAAIRELEDCLLVPPQEESHRLLDEYYRLPHWLLTKIYAEKKGDYATAERHLADYESLGSDDETLAELHMVMAGVYATKGQDAKKARKHLNRFVELGGDRKDAARIRRKIEELENPSKDNSSGL
ncbi:MAG: hypothetical protein O7H41_16670 [Planctomycetota bacterium]|nr:hypothetical protein [Planctomycetota bacterium]